MVEYLPLIIASLVTGGFLTYMININNQKTETEEKKDNTQLFILSAISFVIVYMISNVIIDNNDNKHVMNHIKLGEPPF
jgi:heme O synthase-like polyprenyltransferase